LAGGGGVPPISKSKWEGLHPGKIYIKYKILKNYFFLLIQIKFIVIDYTPPDTDSISRFIFISGDLDSYLVPLLCLPMLDYQEVALLFRFPSGTTYQYPGSLPYWEVDSYLVPLFPCTLK
jgi:hypothetical protein